MNTTTNIMSVSSGNVQGSSSGQSVSDATSVRSTDRSAGTSADVPSKDTFHDALNKAQDHDASQQPQKDAQSASKADTQEAQAAAESVSIPSVKPDKKVAGSDKKNAGSEKDTLASADDHGLTAALLNAAVGVVVQVPAAQATPAAVQTGCSEIVLAGAQANDNMPQTVENSVSTGMPAVLDDAVSGQTPAQNVSLGALLPQNMKAAEQNQQLLDMLAARTNGAASVTAATVATTAASVTTATVANGLQPAAATVNLSNTTTASSSSNAADNSSKVDSLLNGASLVVEDHTNQQGLLQQNMGQQMADSRQQGGAFAQTAGRAAVQEVVDAGGSRVRQLSEEADFDAAPVKSNASAVSDNPSGLSVSANTFQQNLQDVAGTSAQAEVSQPQTDYDVPQQIVDQARLIKSTDNTEMVIKLKPEHLGDLTLKVSVTANGAVNASFHSDNAQVRTIIENSMVQLRQELQAQGLKVDNVGVYAGLGDGSLMNSQQQGQAAYQQPNQTTAVRSEKVDLAAFEEETDTLTAVSPSAASMNDGVDYRI